MMSIHGTHSMICLLALPLVLAGVLQSARAADTTSPATGKPARILFVTQSFTFKHTAVDRKDAPLSVAEQAVTDWGAANNLYHVDCTQDVAKDLTKDNLKNYDIVMFYTTGPRAKWPVDDETLDYLCKEWVKERGHGFIGVHSGADTLGDYQPYWEMLGGTFNEHPWNAKCDVTINIDDPDHPICKPWGTKDFTITDEIYQFKNWQPEKVRVLMSLDIGRSTFTKEVKDKIRQPYHIPIAWCKQIGDGRVFHMSLGHNESVWADPRYRDSMLGGIRWVLGQEPGSATPNPEVDAAQVEKGNMDVAAKLAAFLAD
jgi:type 1 glutamine amidotransferase